MRSDLMRVVQAAEPRPRGSNRAIVMAARALHDDVRLSALQVDGSLALAGHAMEGLLDLDAHRRLLAADDLSLHTLLGEIQQQAVAQVKRIQRDLFSDWTA